MLVGARCLVQGLDLVHRQKQLEIISDCPMVGDDYGGHAGNTSLGLFQLVLLQEVFLKLLESDRLCRVLHQCLGHLLQVGSRPNRRTAD